MKDMEIKATDCITNSVLDEINKMFGGMNIKASIYYLFACFLSY